MSRKKAPKVTAKVTKPPLTEAEKAKIAAPIMPDIMQAMDYAAETGQEIGHLRGRVDGLTEGLTLPRNEGEARAARSKGAVARILQEVFAETQKAIGKHGAQHSPHEGYAVLLEEVDELWDEIKSDRGRQASARTEAIQIAAMAVRYVLDNNPR